MKNRKGTKSTAEIASTNVGEKPSTLSSTSSSDPSSSVQHSLSSTSLKLSALHLALFLAQFKSLVSYPIQALTWGLLPLSVLQGIWLVKCLYDADIPTSATPFTQSLYALRTLLPTLIFGTPITAIILILFGAPLTTHHAQTILCASHMALMAGSGLVRRCGMDGKRWRKTCALLDPVDEVVGGAMGTALGAWLGAVPIPLDWSVFFVLLSLKILCSKLSKSRVLYQD